MSQGLKSLATTPEGVQRAAELIDGLDQAFMVGFGRLGAEQLRTLDTLGKAFTGTPLDARLSEALAAVRRNEFVEKHFVALAAARSALQGAQHDALSAQAAEALGRPALGEAPGVEADVQAQPSHHEVYLESVRHWLMEVALGGFLQLTPETLLPFGATLEKLQAEPGLLRASSLLTGFFEELVFSMPVSALHEVPAHRWVDLWSRAMVLSVKTPPPVRREAASGNMHLMGVDLRQHGFFASAVFHALLVEGDSARHVRATLSQYKVDVVFGTELWRLLGVKASRLVQALSEGKQLSVKDMPITQAGDFLWNDAKASLVSKLDVEGPASKWLVAGAKLQRCALPGWDRHPAQLGELVYISDHRLTGREGSSPTLALADGTNLPVATERMAMATDFSVTELGMGPVVGLLRYDRGGWRVQPLTLVKKGKKVETLVLGSLAAGGSGKGALEILRYKAGKLLRAKS